MGFFAGKIGLKSNSLCLNWMEQIMLKLFRILQKTISHNHIAYKVFLILCNFTYFIFLTATTKHQSLNSHEFYTLYNWIKAHESYFFILYFTAFTNIFLSDFDLLALGRSTKGDTLLKVWELLLNIQFMTIYKVKVITLVKDTTLMYLEAS